MKFSANLGFLWRELSLPEAIRASKQAGFHAVECHWPYDVTTAEMKTALAETGLTMLSLNTIRGHRDAGENGLSALVGRETEARFAIDQAIAYAAAISTPNIHVMAGFASGDMAHQTFIENLQYATAQAVAHGMTILIEPLNHYDAPGYFLQTSGQARAIIEEVGADNLKLMFDCYHLQVMEGNISRRLAELLPMIGHIQIASVPDRAEPDSGELDYGYVFEVLEGLGYEGFIGAEYRPHNGTDNGLGWLRN